MTQPFPYVAAAWLTAVLLLAGGPDARAQVGASTDAWIRCYGPPLSGSVDGDIQTLTFGKDGLEIVFFGRNGIGHRAIYQKKGIAAREVKRLLELNRESAVWTEWLPPGQAELNPMSTRWRRSDNQAMAVLKGDVLTVTDAGWRPEAPVESAPARMAASPVPPAERLVPAVRALPKPKPGQPSVMPSPGDSRDRILAVLGGPLGHMLSGKMEIWVYAWGHILLENGLFVKIDDPVFLP